MTYVSRENFRLAQELRHEAERVLGTAPEEVHVEALERLSEWKHRTVRRRAFSAVA